MERFYLKLGLLFIMFVIAGWIIKAKEILVFSNIVLSGYLVISSFIFGILIAFSISGRRARLNSIRENLREQDAILLNIYNLSKLFGNKIIKKVRNKIDDYLILQLDYKLEDFGKSIQGLMRLNEFLEKVESKTKLQEEAKSKILDQADELTKIHKKVFYEVKEKMMAYDWFSLFILSGVIIFCLFYINNNTIMSIFITGIISTSLVLLFFILIELDNLKWQEQNWIWIPISELFLELGLMPYFPEEVFKKKRLNYKKIKKNGKIRIAHYPEKYPNMAGKTVEIV
ncbi:MAG: hypothetical protein ACOYT4_01650 [Nanoarchaeota archaeon]